IHHDRHPGVGKPDRFSHPYTPHVYLPCAAPPPGDRFAHHVAIAIERIKSSWRPVRAAYVLRPASLSLRRKSLSSSFKLSASPSAAANLRRPSCIKASTTATSSDFATCQRPCTGVISVPAVMTTRTGRKPRSSMRSPTARPTPVSSTTTSAPLRLLLVSAHSGLRSSRNIT